jgi:adenine phosphoribosyltransferase
MDFLDEVSIVGSTAQRRRILAHPFDPRYRALDVKRLREAMAGLAAVIDTAAVDYVLGFPVGGIVPALAFAEIIDRPLIVSMLLEPDRPGAILFEEPHSIVARVHYIQGLRPGDRVVIVEDEVTTGRTAVNAVRALRAAGVGVTDVGALLVVDHPSVWGRFAAARVALHACIKLPAAYGDAIVGPAS